MLSSSGPTIWELLMKALTVKQPWAWAILHAGKDIENREWRTHYRGPLAVHAGARLHRDAALPRRSPMLGPRDLVFSAILGVVDLVDVVESNRSKWFHGTFGWVLKNPRPLARPILCKGRLGLWSLSASQLRAIERQL
jgi:hypothetical protein